VQYLIRFNFEHDQNTNRRALWFLIALAIGAFLYSVIAHSELRNSGLMFLGIPTVLAILLALTPKAKTATGAIIKGITLALLILAPLLGEGYLCILLAAPLFYAVGIIIGLIADYEKRRSRRTTLSCLAVAMLPLSMEGVIPHWSFDRSQTVEATRIVYASSRDVETALAHSPKVGTPLPRFLRIGFPRPLEAHGEGLAVEASRTIHFAGAEGDPPGDLVMQITASHPGYVRFDAVRDTSKLPQWIRWDASEIAWHALDATHTAVTWRIRFERQLDPAWYFTPWERAAVRDAAAYLIEANATPGAAR
jgi:hypothetical protein